MPSIHRFPLNPDYVDMLSALSSEGVEFLIVGAYALGVHAEARATGDIDVWLRPTAQNSRRTWRALARFGAPVADLDPEWFSEPDRVLQVGIVPARVDLMTSIEGVTFDEAWPKRVPLEFGELSVAVLGRDDFIRNKRSTGREKDVVDANAVERFEQRFGRRTPPSS